MPRGTHLAAFPTIPPLRWSSRFTRGVPVPRPRSTSRRTTRSRAPQIHGTQFCWDAVPPGFRRRRIGPGTEFLRQGYPAVEVFVLRDGVVKLVDSAADGRGTIVGLRMRESIHGVGPAL